MRTKNRLFRVSSGLPGMMLLILTLALFAGPRAAQAQGSSPIAIERGVRMYVNPNHAILCLKQKKTFGAYVGRDVDLQYPDGKVIQKTAVIPMSKYAYDNSDAAIGSVTISGGPNGAQITFSAEKIGLTIVTIKAIAPPPRSGDPPIEIQKPVPIEVIDCGFKVSATVNWSGAGLDQVRHFTGRMPEVSLTPKPTGGFAASGTVEWMEDISEACCKVETKPKVLKTSAVITGTLDELGIILDFKFTPLGHTTCGTGGGGTKCLPDQWAFSSLHVYFPIEDLASTRHEGQFAVTLTRVFSTGGAK